MDIVAGDDGGEGIRPAEGVEGDAGAAAAFAGHDAEGDPAALELGEQVIDAVEGFDNIAMLLRVMIVVALQRLLAGGAGQLAADHLVIGDAET